MENQTMMGLLEEQEEVMAPVDLDLGHYQIGVVMSTKNLDFFSFHDDNRKVTRGHIQRVKKSIKQHGQLDPIKVNSKGVILNGQHRYLAIKELHKEGIYEAVKYIEVDSMDDVSTILTLNAVQKELTITDYVEIYARNGHVQYQKIMDLASKYNQTPSAIISIMYCGAQSAMVKNNIIKYGQDIDFDDWNLLEEYFEWLYGVDEYLHVILKPKEILFRIYQLQVFDPEIFKERVKSEYIFRNEKVRFSTSMNICKKQIIDLYNKGLSKTGKNYIHYMMDAGGKIILR